MAGAASRPQRVFDRHVTSSANPAIDTVLFDVDGTLVDSTYHHAIAWARAFARFDLFPPMWRVHRAVGMGGDNLVPDVVGDDVEKRHGDDLRSAWEEEYRTILPDVRPFDGAAQAVRAVRDKGYKVALASSGKSEFTDAAMSKLGLSRDEVDAVTSSDDADNSKPEPDILLVALRAAGGERAVLVGDATWDAESAGRVADPGMPCVTVLTGGFSAAELEEAGALAVYGSITEMRDGSWIDALD